MYVSIYLYSSTLHALSTLLLKKINNNIYKKTKPPHQSCFLSWTQTLGVQLEQYEFIFLFILIFLSFKEISFFYSKYAILL